MSNPMMMPRGRQRFDTLGGQLVFQLMRLHREKNSEECAECKVPFPCPTVALVEQVVTGAQQA